MDDFQFFVLLNGISVISGQLECNHDKPDRSIGFSTFSTVVRYILAMGEVFRSYHEDGRMIMKGCVQWDLVIG